MICQHCNNTGSLSKDIDGHLDCGHCDTARERADLNAWAAAHLKHVSSASAERWALYLYGQAAAAARGAA